MNKMTEEHKKTVRDCIEGMRNEIKERLMKEWHLTDSKTSRIVESTANKWFAIAKNRCKGISKNELGNYWKYVRKTDVKSPDLYFSYRSHNVILIY